MKIRYGPAPALAIDMAAGPGNPLTMYMPLSSDAAGLNLKDPVYAALQRILGPIGASTDVVENRLPTRPSYYYIQVGRRSAPYLNKL